MPYLIGIRAQTAATILVLLSSRQFGYVACDASTMVQGIDALVRPSHAVIGHQPRHAHSAGSSSRQIGQPERPKRSPGQGFRYPDRGFPNKGGGGRDGDQTTTPSRLSRDGPDDPVAAWNLLNGPWWGKAAGALLAHDLMFNPRYNCRRAAGPRRGETNDHPTRH